MRTTTSWAGLDPDQTMKILAHYRNPNSPRGPFAIDPATRDIVHNIYIRETRKIGNRLFNVEIETIPSSRTRGRNSSRSNPDALAPCD